MLCAPRLTQCASCLCCLQDVADSCRTGAATDIIFGLALGYKSTIIPCFVLAITIYIANSLAGASCQSAAAVAALIHAVSTRPKSEQVQSSSVAGRRD